jgi:Tol biopolymer transport system component
MFKILFAYINTRLADSPLPIQVMNKRIFLVLLSVPSFLFAQEKNLRFELSSYAGEYLGLKQPGTRPEKFAPGFISIENETTHCLVFSPDGNHLVYTWADSAWSHWGIMYSRRVKDHWLKPRLLKFEGCDKVPFNPTFSNDSRSIIFTMESTKWPDTDIYSIALTDSGYSPAPQRMNTPINTSGLDFGYFMDKDGSIYFTGRRAEFVGGLFDIYVCCKENGNYVTRNLKSLNSVLDDAAPFISPDGTYMIYEQMVNDTGMVYNDSTARIIRIDLFVSFRDKDNNWTTPVNLGKEINSDKYKTYRPVISPDGKFLFYSQTARKGAAVYWVSTKVIGRLRPAR